MFRPELAAPVTSDSKVGLSDEARVLDSMLIALAEIGMSVDTFASRCSASTETDYVSMMICAIATRMSSLNKPQECANIMSNCSLEEITEGLRNGSINFGFLKFKDSDPRIDALRHLLPSIMSPVILEKCEKVETIAKEAREVNVSAQPNISIYCGLIIISLGLPKEVIDMFYIVSRLAGWTAHVREQLLNNKLVRPRSIYVGHEPRSFTDDWNKIKAAEELENGIAKACDFSSPNTKENPIVLSRDR